MSLYLQRGIYPVAMILLLLSHTTLAQNDPEYELPEVVVTAGRIPTTHSELARTVTVVSRDELARMPDRTVQGVLASIQGVDIRRRGPNGVQADVALRGGSFEQTLVLVDGVPITDPQTGHNTLNVPISYDEIDRIEVLKGPGSRAFGANAFSGVINIITRNVHNPKLSFRMSTGEHGLFGAGISGAATVGTTRHSLSYERGQSDGYMRNTDYLNEAFTYSFSLPMKKVIIGLRAGYADKQFGANGFYSDRFPLQWEHTKTGLVSGTIDADHGLVQSRLALSWRNGGDEFLLNREDPAFYRNVHSTNKYTALYSATTDWAAGTTVAGLEVQHDAINSTNLGIHERTTGGLFLEHRLQPWKAISVSFGGFAHKYGSYGWEFAPGADAAWNFTRSWKLYGSVGRSFRIPTFTELYYSDPANIGNADLEPELAWTYEAGIGWESARMRANLSAFQRDAENLIDWTRETPSDPWQVMNFTKVTTRGIEASLDVAVSKRWLPRVRAGYAWLESDVNTGGEDSKYVLEHLRHQATLELMHWLPLGIQPTWRARFIQRIDQPESYIVTDLRISRGFGDLDIFLSATNLFDQPYKEIGTVPMPGRWIQGGITYHAPFD